MLHPAKTSLFEIIGIQANKVNQYNANEPALQGRPRKEIWGELAALGG
jgi:hypothetical protein